MLPVPVDAPTWASALRQWLLPAGVLLAVLLPFAGRYGYHRDELYFLEAGTRPAWGYPDQPGAVPLLAHAWWTLTGGSLAGFRVLPALAAAGAVVVAALTAAELARGRAGILDRRVPLLAAAATATASTLVGVGHLFSTTTFDALATAVLLLLLLRAVRARTPGAWLWLGAATGLACHVKLLPLVVLACCGTAILLTGQRRALASRWPWAAAALATALASPVLLWQAANGWPQAEVARGIAAGGSATSVDRWLVVPLQVTVVGPLLLPLLVVGLVALWRSPHRWVAVAYGLLLAQVVTSGGKPYYTLGLVPVLMAAAAPPVLRWVRRGAGAGASAGAELRAPRRRAAALVTVLVLNLVGGALVTMPWPPARDLGWQLAVNPDLGEQVGWPELVDVVARQAAALPPGSTVVLAGNYGEAGALALARRTGTDLPPVYSGHQGFWWWGPPPTTATTVLTVGTLPRSAPGVLTDCEQVATLSNAAGVPNEESGTPVAVCTHTGSWDADWPSLRRLT